MVRILKPEVGGDQIEDVVKRAVPPACNCNGSHQLPERNVNPPPYRLDAEQQQPLLFVACERAAIFAAV